MLEVRNIYKKFGTSAVLDNINLRLSKGEVFGFLGPNGAGKTTVIRIILGLIRPDKGTVYINGYNIKKDFCRAISSVGAVVEAPKFYSQLTGYQNILLAANLHPAIPNNRIRELLDIVGLSKRAHDKVAAYSLGMKQRLGIARAMVNDPQVILLDEPMNGLDPQGIYEIKALITGLARNKNTTFFITSHLLNEIEQVCDKIAVIKTGKILEQGKVAELLNKDTEVIELDTDAKEIAYLLLKDLGCVRNINPVDHRLVVEIDKGCSSALIKVLVNRDIGIKYVIPRKQSLENYYIELTNGGSYAD